MDDTPQSLTPPPPPPKRYTVWMRALRFHTYEKRPIEPGTVYLAAEDIVETIEILGFARREPPPRRARKPPPFTSHDA